MTDAQTPGPQVPAPPDETEAPARGERIGTILMTVAIAAVAVLVIDVATKGRLLAPLFALLPAPKPSTPESPDGAASPAGE